MLFGKIVKYKDGQYHVAGGIRVQQNSSKFDSYVKVTQQSDTLVKCMFTSYTELPKVILTYLNYSRPVAHELDVFVKWVYHNNIDVYIGLFGEHAHIEKNDELRNFLKTARFIQRVKNVNHNNIFKLKSTLEVIYFSIDEYDRCFLNEQEDSHVVHHHNIDTYKLVIYMTPAGATSNLHETIKIVPIHLE
jgi:hypothetical protein